MAFLLAAENQLYVIALVLMFGIALIEGVASLLGAGFSAALESVLPEMDVEPELTSTHATADTNAHTNSGLLTRLLGWLHLGKVPALVLLIVALTVFGLIGLAVQWVLHSVLGTLAFGTWLAVPVLLMSLPVIRASAITLYKLMPSDETEAVSESTFIGRMATVTLGRASVNNPAQARVTDAFGQSHYVMLEPDDASEVFQAGDRVLAVAKRGAVFIAIRSNSAGLA